MKHQIYNKYKLPITDKISEYGTISDVIVNTYIVHINIRNIAHITINNNVNKVKFYKLGELVLEWNDINIDDKTFIRQIGCIEYTFTNKKLVLKTIKTENKPD